MSGEEGEMGKGLAHIIQEVLCDDAVTCIDIVRLETWFFLLW